MVRMVSSMFSSPYPGAFGVFGVLRSDDGVNSVKEAELKPPDSLPLERFLFRQRLPQAGVRHLRTVLQFNARRSIGHSCHPYRPGEKNGRRIFAIGLKLEFLSNGRRMSPISRKNFATRNKRTQSLGVGAGGLGVSARLFAKEFLHSLL